MNKLKTYYALYKLAKNIIIRFFILLIIVLASMHLSENPIGISVIILLCLIVFGFVKDERMRIFESHFEIQSIYICGLYMTTQRYDLSNTVDVSIEGDLIVDGKAFNETVSDRQFSDVSNKLLITDITNNKIEIKTRISKIQLREAMEFIQQGLEKKQKTVEYSE